MTAVNPPSDTFVLPFGEGARTTEGVKEKRPQRSDFGMVVAVVVLIVAVGAAWFLARGKAAPAAQTPVASAPAATPDTAPPPQAAASSPVALPPPQSARASAPAPSIPAAAPPAAPEPTPADLASVPRVPTTELAQKLGSVTVIDVRDADSYIAGHVAGAMHIPLQYLPGEVPYLPKDKPIVTYCT